MVHGPADSRDNNAMHTKRRWCAASTWLDHCRRSVIADVIPLVNRMAATFTGHHAETQRKLILHHVKSLTELPGSLSPDGRYFVAMLVCDARILTTNAIATAARKLIDDGCVYICCWGHDCERVHDIFDEELVENGFDDASDDTIMTTWHAEEPLKDFIHFSLLHTEPTSKFRTDCSALVAIVIDDAEHATTIRNAFSNSDEFFAST